MQNRPIGTYESSRRALPLLAKGKKVVRREDSAAIRHHGMTVKTIDIYKDCRRHLTVTIVAPNPYSWNEAS